MDYLLLITLILYTLINQPNKAIIMSIYEINSKGTLLVYEKAKEFYKMIIGGIVFYLLLFFVAKYTIGDNGYFVFLMCYLTTIYLFMFVFIPISLRIRINKLVRKVQFINNQVLFFTNKENIYAKNEIITKEVKNRFSGFSRRRKDGILVKAKDGKEFWIVEDFFNDYERLRDMLAEFTG